jgi:hypothetical protein
MKLLIPPKYTRYAHITSLFILRNGVYMILYSEYVTGVLLLLTYITTNLHWHNLKPTSMVKNIDMLLVSSTFLYSIYAASFYDCRMRYYICSCVSVGGFCLNEYWNMQTIYQPNFHQRPESYKNAAYIRTCVVHMFFLHLFQLENAITVVSYCTK